VKAENFMMLSFMVGVLAAVNMILGVVFDEPVWLVFASGVAVLVALVALIVSGARYTAGR
jgi:hypothetical protein